MHAQQPQAGRDLGACARGGIRVDIGLVDHHQVRQLHHALLDGLQIVTRIGQLQQHKHVRHTVHRRLALAHAHGFDDDDVIARRFTDEHGLARFLGNTAQRAAAGAGTDIGFLAHGQLLHAGLVTQDGATGNRARRINRQHRHAVAQANQVQAQGFDEGRLAHTRHAAYP